jgi:hypothetical protein
MSGDSAMNEPDQLTADEMAFRIARECHVTEVTDITHWPVRVMDRRYGNSPSLACDAFTYRDFKGSEPFLTQCEHEFTSRNIASLGEEIIQHLCHTRHCSPPFQPPTKQVFVAPEQNVPVIPPPPAEPQPAGKTKHLCLHCDTRIQEGEIETLITGRGKSTERRYHHTNPEDCQKAIRRPQPPRMRVPGSVSQ